MEYARHKSPAEQSHSGAMIARRTQACNICGESRRQPTLTGTAQVVSEIGAGFQHPFAVPYEPRARHEGFPADPVCCQE